MKFVIIHVLVCSVLIHILCIIKCVFVTGLKLLFFEDINILQ